MIKHILTMLYNQKKKFTAVIFEQVLVFMALSVSLTVALDTYRSYQSPGMLDVDNVVGFGYLINKNHDWQDSEKSAGVMDAVKDRLEQKPYVEKISEGLQLVPYMRPARDYWADSVSFVSGKKVYVHFKVADEATESVFKPDITRGRWFRDGERVNGLPPVVITEQLAAASEIEDPIGKIVYWRGQAYSITGIVSGVKEAALEEALPCIILPFSFMNGMAGVYEELAARIKPGYEDDFVNDFYLEWNRMWGADYKAEPCLYLLDELEKVNMEGAITKTVSVVIPALFLLLFTLIGTVGINLIDVEKRKRELALRVACGASKKSIMNMIIAQNAVITGISSIPGIIVILLSFPWETSLPVVGFTVVLTLMLSVLCALYPAFKIFSMKPAELLKEE